MSSTDFDAKAVLQFDSWLQPFIPAIDHRYQLFKQWKHTIFQHEGGYESFTRGYEKFGFNVGESGEVIYREWAPNVKEANLIGDFSQYPVVFVLLAHLIRYC